MKPVVELKNATKIIDNGMNEKKSDFGSCELSHLS